MYCFRCGSKVRENEKYCPHCGADVLEELKRYSYPEFERKEEIPTPTHNDQYEYSIKYSFQDTEDLVKAYVGKNYDKIKNTKFSIPTLLLGPLYFFYRKMYPYGLLWIFTIIVFGTLLSPLSIILPIIFATLFAQLYLNDVKRKVNNIKLQNKTTDKETLYNTCKKKGGVNITLPILIVILGIVILSFIIELPDLTKEKPLDKKQEYSIGSLSYTIPKGYIKSEYETEDYKSYSYIDDDKYCHISLDAYDYTTLYNNAEEYLKDSIYRSETDTVSEVETLLLNGTEWKTMSVSSEYEVENYYTYKDGNTYYKIKTSDDIDKPCQEDYQKILNSITEKE